VTSFPARLAVVSGLRTDFLHLPRRGHVTVFSALDKNLSFHSAPLDHREHFTMQVPVLTSLCSALLDFFSHSHKACEK